MAFNRKPCALCKSPMEYGELPVLAGNEQSCRVALRNVPVMLCANGHKRLLYPSFVTELMDVLARPETTGLRVGEKRGLFRKRFLCAKCASEIQTESKALAEYKTSLRLKDVMDSIGIALTMPIVRCEACGNEQLADESDLMQLFKALTHAFRSADVNAQ